MKDLPLNLLTHDFDPAAPLVVDKDHVRQSLKIRLLFFLGEWFLDITAGVAYYQEIFKKHPKGLARVEAIFKEAITGTPGVKTLTDFRYTFDAPNRVYNFSFVVDTIFGELRGTVTQSVATAPQLPVIVITDNIVMQGV